MPLFSVIIPVYNVEPFIVECLDSVMRQSCDDYEAILVDDGSTDRSGQICDDYSLRDSRFRVIHKPNGGLVSARQAGVLVADGEHCVAVDSDDRISETYLESFKRAIDGCNPDVVCAGIRLVDGEGCADSIPPLEVGFYGKDAIVRKVFPRLIQSPRAESFEPNICSKAIRRTLYETCQLAVSTQIRNGEDSACTIPCFYRANSMYLLHECGYFYRYNRESMTKNLKPMPWDQQKVLSGHLRGVIDTSSYDFEAQMSRRVCHGLFNICVSQFFSNRAYREVKADIKLHLQEPEYQEAIRAARFSSPRAKLMHYALRYETVPLMWLYAKAKIARNG